MTTLCFFAIFVNASVLGPGIVSASLKKRWSSTWQKYCEPKSSCVEMIFAPPRAASSTRRTWFFRFALKSLVHAICVSPTVTIESDDVDADGMRATLLVFVLVRFFMLDK